jgi:hypothetical protein
MYIFLDTRTQTCAFIQVGSNRIIKLVRFISSWLLTWYLYFKWSTTLFMLIGIYRSKTLKYFCCNFFKYIFLLYLMSYDSRSTCLLADVVFHLQIQISCYRTYTNKFSYALDFICHHQHKKKFLSSVCSESQTRWVWLC